MKKNIFISLAVIVVAAVAAFNVNFNVQEDGLSSISLENVEALASEGGGGYDCCDSCSGSYCGTFVDASGNSTKVYYK